MSSRTVHNLLLFLPSLEKGSALSPEDRQELFKLLINGAREDEALMVLQAVKKYTLVDYSGFADCAREYLTNLPDKDFVELINLIIRGLDDPEVKDVELAAALSVAKLDVSNIAFSLLMPLVDHLRPAVLTIAMEQPVPVYVYFNALFNQNDPP